MVVVVVVVVGGVGGMGELAEGRGNIPRAAGNCSGPPLHHAHVMHALPNPETHDNHGDSPPLGQVVRTEKDNTHPNRTRNTRHMSRYARQTHDNC